MGLWVYSTTMKPTSRFFPGPVWSCLNAPFMINPSSIPLPQPAYGVKRSAAARPLVVNDYAGSQEEKKGFPSGHIALHRLLVVPVFDDNRVAALAAVANKPEPYDDQDSRQLTLLLQGMWRHLRRQRSEQAMVQEIERMHQFQTKMIQTSNDGIVASDGQGNILIFNAGAEKILGYRQEEVIGKIKVQAIYPPNSAGQILKKLFSSDFGGRGRLINHETVVFSKSGELIPVELSATLIVEDHEITAVVGFFRDLRERRLLQEKVLQNERLAVLGQMAAHISHEIKNPLMVIGGFARQVKENFNGPKEKNLEKLQIVIDEIKRLEGFLVEVGRYAKFSEPRLSAGNLNALIQDTCTFLDADFRGKRHRLKIRSRRCPALFPLRPGSYPPGYSEPSKKCPRSHGTARNSVSRQPHFPRKYSGSHIRYWSRHPSRCSG